jgi:AraC-like DNA-binding protein
MGPGLPHTWVSDHTMMDKCKAVVIQFSAAFINRFTGIDEFSNISSLLNKSNLGIAFNEKNTEHVNKLMMQLPAKKGIERIAIFLQLLDELSKLKTKSLASSYYQPLKGVENEKRINKVFQYIQKHATEPLTIQKASSVIHLTPSAFCKFFKRVTGKTFSDYVNDIRIANVCTQLIATDKQVAAIAYENGFETLTYFNRVFLKKKGMKPSEYRRK